MAPNRPEALFIGLTRVPALPWWWGRVDHDALRCRLTCEPIVVEKGRPEHPLSVRFIRMNLRIAAALFRARRRGAQYVFSVECDWPSFTIGALQTLLMFRRPQHVILQFIMRERTETLASRIKYAFMRWCFRSVHLCICSSRTEAEYYASAFGWPAGKLAYVPILTDPAFVERAGRAEEPFAFSAGRTFRDYPTLLEAFRDSGVPLRIVAGRSNLSPATIPADVTVEFDLPLPELIELMARSMLVVLPLEDRQISIGQSVLLEAMAMGKPVIVTRVNGTIDYIEHMKTGILVPPRDAGAIRDAVRMLAGDADLRRRIGAAARAQVLDGHLPDHYAQGLARALAGATP